MFEKIQSSLKKLKRKVDPFDNMQRFTKVGQYHVGAVEATPHRQNYYLVVKYNNQNILKQYLIPEDDHQGLKTYQRSWSKKLKRFEAFEEVDSKRRYTMQENIEKFSERVQKFISPDTLNVGLITDTYDKQHVLARHLKSDGLQQIQEFNTLSDMGLLDLKVHLGDWISGCDEGYTSQKRLREMRDAFQDGLVPFVNLKGNSDDNDSYDAKESKWPSFGEREFEDIMWHQMYQQEELNAIYSSNGVSYYDYQNFRLIFINTSDLPYEIDDQGKKRFNTKKTLAVREDQVEEIIEILSISHHKRLIFMGHSVPVNRRGDNALKYNGRTLHELFAAFNQKATGHLSNHGVPVEFKLNNQFDFSAIVDSQIVAYIGGHHQVESNYKLNGIDYVTLNTSSHLKSETNFNRREKRDLDTPNEVAGYILNINPSADELQLFGYGAATFRKIFKI
ncbi:serine/threonine protein phosphatase [Holzapfeliella sp. He02]|uniref:Serine/threonine protein phosphatase n=1 Tax=Holzapfeliella saturejae TaxID=3082953 RepID=A0ABU8SG51_9LACO